MATIKDVARLAGVSASTVSHVVNRTRVVSDTAQQRVNRAIAELNYIPNSMARSLKGGASRVFGMLVTDSTNPFYANLIQQVEQAAYQQGYSLILCNTHGDVDCARAHLGMLLQRRIDGLLVLSAETRLDGMEPIRAMADLPVVVMDWGPSEDRFDRIQDDSQLGGYLATRHLLQRGHRDIHCLMGPLAKSNSQQRLRGFQRALAEFGLAEGKVHETGFTCEGGYRTMQALLAGNARPSAIFAGNDLIAMGAIRAASEAGLRVPEDLSVVGYDDIPQAAYLNPPLTTVRQPVAALAAQAINLLLQRVDAPAASGRLIKIEPGLVSRGSVCEVS